MVSKYGTPPATSASTGNLLKMQIWELYLRPTESESQVGPREPCFRSLSGDSHAHQSLRTTGPAQLTNIRKNTEAHLGLTMDSNEDCAIN